MCLKHMFYVVLVDFKGNLSQYTANMFLCSRRLKQMEDSLQGSFSTRGPKPRELRGLRTERWLRGDQA